MNTNYQQPVSLKILKEIINLLSVSVVMIMATPTILSAQYPPLSIPTAYLSPSGEKGQILLDGLVKEVSLFHGKSDEEADWHIYISLSDKVKNDLTNSAKKEYPKVTHDFNEIYSELMVIDNYRNLSVFDNPPLGDEKYYSADVTKPFLLFRSGSDHPAWDFGVEVTRKQGGDGLDYTNNSKLKSGRVYLQGAYVNDKAHSASPLYLVRAEIHPLDAIAFAMNEDGSVYSTKYGEEGWAESFVRWRVAFFANSTYHRINRESYLKKDRVTTFYLDLPNDYYNNSNTVYYVDLKIDSERQILWDGAKNREYLGKGLRSLSPSQGKSGRWGSHSSRDIVPDPSDGRKKLKVTATMKRPDTFGGIVVIDYIVRVSLNQRAKN